MFSREQLEIVVRAMFEGARQRIDQYMPYGVPRAEAQALKEFVWTGFNNILGTFSNILVEFYTAVRGVSRRTGDFPQYEIFRRHVELHWNGVVDGKTDKFPSMDALAREFVREIFCVS